MSRTRTRSNPISWSLNRQYLDTGGNIVTNIGTTFTDSTQTEQMSDTVTPGFFTKRRRGLTLPVNPMTHTVIRKDVSAGGLALWKRNLQYSPFTFRGNANISGEVAQAYHWGKTSTWPAWVGSTPSWETDSVVVTAALANARTMGFDALTFLAEWHKTVDMIRGFRERTLLRAERVADAVRRAYKKPTKLHNAKRWADAIDGFTQSWLEARYGWRILAYDLDSINKALIRLNETHSNLRRGYSTASDSRTRTLYNTSAVTSVNLRTNPSEAGMNAPGTGFLKQDLVYTKRAGALLTHLATDFLSLNPLVTAYEVIPFSFVVDWFTNLGDVVASYEPFASENLQGGWVSTLEELKTYSRFTPATGNIYTSESQTWTLLSGSTMNTQLNKKTYSRYAVSPSATFSFRLNIDAAKILDLSSIFHARYRGLLGNLMKLNRV